MLIYCPKCQQGYNVDENLIPPEGRRLRCGNCHEVFHFDGSGQTVAIEPEIAVEQINFPETESEIQNSTEESVIEIPTEEQKEGVIESAPEETSQEDTAQETEIVQEEETPLEEPDGPVDMNDIFKRLSEQTVGLFEKEKKLSTKERWLLKFKSLTGLYMHIRPIYVVAFLFVVGVISLYNNRYDVSRKFPWFASVYGMFGIESQVLGEGLEFQNINWVYYEKEDTPVLEVNGFINNPTSRPLKLPVVRVEMLDVNAVLLKSQNQQPERDVLNGKTRLPIKVVVTKPSPTTKYVFLTFVEAES